MAEILTALLTYGPLGIFCAALWLANNKLKTELEDLHTKSKAETKELNDKIRSLLESHGAALDNLRKAQTEREKEVSTLLQNYGNGLVTAVEQAHELAERLWSIRK